MPESQHPTHADSTVRWRGAAITNNGSPEALTGTTTIQPTRIPGVGANSCKLTPTSSGDYRQHPTRFGWQSGEHISTRQASRPTMATVMTLPATATAQEATISHISSPSNFIVQPYNAPAASSDCRSVLEDVIMGAGVLLDRPRSRVSRTR
jgi:hypothetical protein